MKNKNLFTTILVLFITLFSCNDDFLDKNPLDSISDETFWNTASDLKLYANQFYPRFDYVRTYIGGSTSMNSWSRREANSDNYTLASRNTYLWDEYTVPSSGGGWAKADWLYIRRLNYALSRTDKLDLSNPEINTYLAELRFFRALEYHFKVKNFGDVPWLESDLNVDSEELTAPRTSRNTVVAKILEDIDYAIENLPEASGENRLTRYAALAFKLEVALHEGTFRKYHNKGDYESILREAADAGKKIIDSGLFSLYSTGNPENDYFELWTSYDLGGNPEMIMYQEFILGLLTHNNIRLLGEPAAGLTQDFVETYLCTDGLPISLSPLYKGDIVYRNLFENRDPRMTQYVAHPDRKFRIYADGSADYKNLPEFLPQQVSTGYMQIKGHRPYESDRVQNFQETDYPIFRYGKVLIDYAEVMAELGECNQSVLDATVNLLRDRAGMPHLSVDVGFEDPNWPNWEVSVSPLINEIRRERRIELAGESFRWDDLVRWKAGKLVENFKTYYGARDPETGEYYELFLGRVRKWNDRLYLRPLPLEDLVLNSSYDQNPGWEGVK